MRSMRSIVLFGVLVLAFSACGGDDGDQGGGGHSRRDTAGGDDTGGVDTAADACANGSRDEGESDVDCGGPCAPCGLAKACVADADCASGYCGAGYTCQAAACANGQQDPGETGVDCGGPCPACLGAPCGADGDCATGYCKGGLCDVPTCADGLKNGRETGVDCGGPDCSQCGDGQGCLADANCVSGYCKAGFCATPTCTDGAANQGESDVDCGGPCPGCALGKGCAEGADCVSGACQGGACVEVAPSCTDGQKNGAETDVDCGGGCPGCGFGKACGDGDDCTSRLCAEGACVAPASCDDGQKNGDEGDIDCGGPCKACATGKYCNAHADCLSVTCIYGVCKDPTCADGVKNQGEADVDCAGPCGACADGKACAQGDDCASHYCSGGVCVSCSDGKQNGTETDVDCGGGCGKCGLGKDCTKAGDCQSGACEDGACCTPNACGQCVSTPQEVCDGKDNDCDGQTDEASQIGAAPACAKQQGVCKSSVSACKGTQGWACDDAVYKAFNGAYQATETTCDAKDNDCDGQTDEGLLNACGKCGVTPSEACNGTDDDCDGQTDEVAACASCAASPTAITLVSVDAGWGFQMSWKNYFAMLGDKAYVFLSVRGYSYSPTHLYELADGDLAADRTVSVSPVGNPCIWPADGFLHLATTAYHDFGGYSYQQQAYYELLPSGTVQASTWIDDSSNISGAASPIAQGGSTVGLVYWPPSPSGSTYATPIYVTRQSDGTWQQEGTTTGAGDYGLQLGLRSNGQAFVATRSSSFEGPVYVQEIGGETYTVDSGSCESPALRVAPDNTVWVVYPGDVSDYSGTIKAWTLKGSTPSSTPETIGYGSAPNLAFDKAGRPVVVWVSGTTTLSVATRVGGTWQAETVYQAEGTETLGGYTAVGVDSAGRYHVAFATVTPPESGGWNSIDSIRYLMYCSPYSTASATTTPTQPDGCGADPSQTCSSGCGGQGVGGCWCNAQCASYGDCCPDYEACCN